MLCRVVLILVIVAWCFCWFLLLGVWCLVVFYVVVCLNLLVALVWFTGVVIVMGFVCFICFVFGYCFDYLFSVIVVFISVC